MPTDQSEKDRKDKLRMQKKRQDFLLQFENKKESQQSNFQKSLEQGS
jgi:hypothetical protein